MSQTNTTERAQFNSRLGAIATTVGSAIGLGNIWRFPYEAGTHGGGAFMICYIGFILLLGIPLVVAEFMLGRGTRSNVFGAFRKLAPGSLWNNVGVIGISASILILSFYCVVAGWTVEYCYQSAIGSLNLGTMDAYQAHFDSFSTDPWHPLLWTWIFLTINLVILLRGVTKGIERMSNILMPILFLLLVLFCINSLTLSGASKGMYFLFHPDFSAINSKVLLGAMGQAFFSLSLGLGCLMTYSSYFNDSTRLIRNATATAGLDTAVAILSGIIIFPAVFTFGGTPTAGPKLVFEVLPSIFHDLPYGALWSTLFFFLLFLASLTSTLSMSEISIAYFVEEKGMSRTKATLLNGCIAYLLGSLCCLSFGPLSELKIFGLTLFNLFDYLTSNIMLPLGGMLIAIFVGWKLNKEFIMRQLTNNGTVRVRVAGLLMFCIRYVAPAGIALVFLDAIGVL